MTVKCNSNLSIYKSSVVRIQPRPIVYILTIAAFTLQWKRPLYFLQSWKYLQSGPLQKEFADPKLAGWVVGNFWHFQPLWWVAQRALGDLVKVTQQVSQILRTNLFGFSPFLLLLWIMRWTCSTEQHEQSTEFRTHMEGQSLIQLEKDTAED